MSVQEQQKECMPFIEHLICAHHIAGHSIILINKPIKMDISIPFLEIKF